MTTEFVCHITSCTVFGFFTESLVNLMFSFAVHIQLGFFKWIQVLTLTSTNRNASNTMQQFALLCIKKITIKNDSMTDTTREVKGESLSNAFKWWTSEHIKKKKQ